MKFTWDPKKARRNLAKHGVSFESGSEVFSDPYAIFREDYRDESGEMRFQVIGRAQSQTLLLVAFVDRSEEDFEVHQIISARKAVDYEASAYTDQF